jgi:hypothetical protein
VGSLTCPDPGRTIAPRGKRPFRPITRNMKRVIAITVTLLVASSGAALAQTTSQTVSLAEVARAEEARRKTAKKATKVLTNTNLTPAGDTATIPAPPSPAPAASGATNATPGVPTTNIPGGKAGPVDPAAMKDQAYWAGRMSKARTELSRTQMFADSLQTKINSLRTDFVNRDNRVEREKIQQDLNTALAELERLKKEVDTQTKAITAIEDEARRANVPAGWLRP